jgi:gliding motility-associated-like protein
MRILILVFVLFLSGITARGQCLTEFSKLTPEPSPDFTLDFGRSISMHGEFLAVGVPNSDSVGRVTGLVYIYKKQGTQWVRNASIVPASPIEGNQFGWSVKLSQDYIFVGAFGFGGSVYVFRKNGPDWINPVELALWKVPNAQRFATSPNDPIAITPDQNTVAITDIWHQDSSFPNESTGAIFLYQKNAGDEWETTISPTLIPPPEVDCDDFGGGGVQFQGNRMATFTRFAPTGNGRLYVYKDNSGTPSSFQLEAKLAVGDGNYSYGFGPNNFAFTEDGIFTMASVDIGTPNAKWTVVFFEQPQSGSWSDGFITCHFNQNAGSSSNSWEPNVFSTNGKDLMLTSRNADGKGYLTLLKKGSGGWCSPIYETIEESLPSSSTTQRYGLVLTSNQNSEATVGYVSHPNTGITQVALKTFTGSNGIWETSLLYGRKQSTAGHYYGRKILGVGDRLFVSAPYDGTVKANAGAVYIYTKSATGWAKTSKILPPAGGQYDDVFASNMAANGDYLAVAAAGHSPSGKFFVYKKGADWNSPQLIQEIDLSTAGLTVFISGDNIAMSQDWLVMPYMDSGSSGGIEECHIFLALYKFTGSIFQFHQSLCVQGTNFFARSSTVPVSIEGNLIVAGSKIIELSELGVWEIKHQLNSSDPEPIQFNSQFAIVTNGDRFGYSNYVSNGTIFISAPTKDYNGTWDVGAVYVFTKLPNEEWTSRTESAKIIPHVKEESGLFGYSLAAFQNTLIVGSPRNDYYKTGQAINKPGLASIFQAKDYHWKNTEWIADFTGDSFVKDYFGLAVHLDETDFFIGAPIEDLETGKISGSVYMVPTPPIVKLVPPVCLSGQSVQLLGYPFQGTWSGPGITDASQGIFDPALVGPGVYIVEYQTPNCANKGTLQIEVANNPFTVITDGTDRVVCPNINPISVSLEVEEENNVFYLWYYRASSNDVFVSQATSSPTLIATKRGEYQVKANYGVCIALSPVIRVYNEQVEITLEEPATSCNNSNNVLVLTATPTGGLWSGTGVSNGSFIPLNRPPGDYLVTYNYTSPLGCQYSKTTFAKVIIPYTPVLAKSGNICLTGDVTVALNSEAPPSTNVVWMKEDTPQSDFTIIQNGGNSVNIQSNGTVKVVTETTFCSPKEASVIINDSFTASLSPTETSIDFCPSDDKKLTAQSSLPGVSVIWKFYEEFVSNETILNSSGPEVTPKQTGYYYATIEIGGCKVDTSPKHILILPADTVYIPNVFTPNGDGKNDLFRIVTNDPSPSLQIFNRYGKSIFVDTSNSGWNGGDSPAGVYFWYATLNNCIGEPKNHKGSVLLVR